MAAQFRVVKTNKRGKAQNRVLELNFTDGIIQNLNAKGKVQKSHHASKVMFAERVGESMLVLHLPDKKEYKLNFVESKERDMFCAKLVDLCKECKINGGEQLQEVMFDPTKHTSFEDGDGKESFTFRVKATSGNGQFLEDIILFIGKDGIATCDHQSDESAAAAGGGAPNHKVRAFYPYAHVRSWENHGDKVIIEVAKKNEDGTTTHEVVKVKADEESCNAILKAIHTCITNLMERKKADKAAKAAAAASGVSNAIADQIAGAMSSGAIAEEQAPAAPAPAPKAPVTAAERFRRASLVVDVAAMADFTADEEDAMPKGPLGMNAGASSFVARRQSVLAETNRRASLIGGIGNVLGAAGGGSEADMMAAAVAAIDIEDTFDSAGVSGGKVMADVVGVLTEDSGEVDVKSDEGVRRMSLMADVTGEATPDIGGERERRASLLLDLAAFIEEGEDEKGEGFDQTAQTNFDTIQEGSEDEEESEDEFDDFDDMDDGGAAEDNDFDLLGVPTGDTEIF